MPKLFGIWIYSLMAFFWWCAVFLFCFFAPNISSGIMAKKLNIGVIRAQHIVPHGFGRLDLMNIFVTLCHSPAVWKMQAIDVNQHLQEIAPNCFVTLSWLLFFNSEIPYLFGFWKEHNGKILLNQRMPNWLLPQNIHFIYLFVFASQKHLNTTLTWVCRLFRSTVL